MRARWVIHSRSTFNAHHALTIYLGQAEASHSHEWQVEVQVGTDRLNDEGYALDFHAVHRILKDAAAPLEDMDLNQHPEIGKPTPSAERVAEVLAGHLAPKFEVIGGRLISVSVWEGPENRVDLNLG